MRSRKTPETNIVAAVYATNVVLRTLDFITKRGAIGASEALMQGIRS
jgi:hypothetical protein